MASRFVWVALAATLLACWWVEHAEDAPVPKTVAQGPKRQRSLAQVLPLGKPPPATVVPVITRVDREEDAAVNLFAALETPSNDTAELEMPAAVNPYTYAGRLQQAGRWTIFLTDGQQQYVLQAGDHFADGWQVRLLDQQKIVLQHAAERYEIRLDNGVEF